MTHIWLTVIVVGVFIWLTGHEFAAIGPLIVVFAAGALFERRASRDDQ